MCITTPTLISSQQIYQTFFYPALLVYLEGKLCTLAAIIMKKVDRRINSQPHRCRSVKIITRTLSTVDEINDVDNNLSTICCFANSRRLRSFDGKDGRLEDIPFRQEIKRSASLPSHCTRKSKRYDSMEDTLNRHSLLRRASLLLCKSQRETLEESFDDWSITPKLQDQEGEESDLELPNLYTVQEIENMNPSPNLDDLMFLPYQPEVEYSCSEWIPQMIDYPKSFEIAHSSNSDFLFSCPTGDCVTFPSRSVPTIDEISVLTGEEERHALDISDSAMGSTRKLDDHESSPMQFQNETVELRESPSVAGLMDSLAFPTVDDTTTIGCWDISDFSIFKRVGSQPSMKISSSISNSMHSAIYSSFESPRSVMSEGENHNGIPASALSPVAYGCWNLRENIFETEYLSYPEVPNDPSDRTTPKTLTYRKTGRMFPIQGSNNIIHPSPNENSKEKWNRKLSSWYEAQDSLITGEI
jgi:hypothetical protein